jgi:hypothetical protein
MCTAGRVMQAACGRSSAIRLWHGTYPLWTRQQRTPQRHPARAQAGRWASWLAVLVVVAEQEGEGEGRGARGGGPLETGWPGLLPADLTSEQSRIEARKNRINSNRCPSQATPCETGLTTPWPVDLGPLSGSFLPRRRNKSYLVCRSVPGSGTAAPSTRTRTLCAALPRPDPPCLLCLPLCPSHPPRRVTTGLLHSLLTTPSRQ